MQNISKQLSYIDESEYGCANRFLNFGKCLKPLFLQFWLLTPLQFCDFDMWKRLEMADNKKGVFVTGAVLDLAR